jgi:hypothetical protein
MPAATKSLARIIEADLLREPETRPTHNVVDCFTCGRSFLFKQPTGDDSGRFCSFRCRDGYDAGAPRFDPGYASKTNPRWYSLPMGPRGFLISCFGCGKRFDSIGLRCCSTECERTYRRREEAIDVMAEVGIDRPTKRKCGGCGGDIPNWRKGRRVSKAVRFCSPSCGKQHAKNLRMAPDSPNPVLDMEAAKRCP